jgi:WXXGXW repeat (2 copies)
MKFNRSVVGWLVMAAVVLSLSAASFAQIAVGISVRFGPPALPVYAQPICPGPGYFWTPGYWGWTDDAGYYWVPGTWVVAPVGLLWTPGYWGWGGGFYAWHAGYWGPHVGFYGGINYGFGYGGIGFAGGEWRGGAFFYNRSVTNVSVTNVTNIYTRMVVVNENHVAFNGGEGGIHAEPTAEERVAEHEQHTAAIESQTEHERLASQNRENFASENHGRPAIAATARPGDFSSKSAIGAREAGGEYHAPAMSPKEARGPSEPAKAGGSDGFRSFTPPAKNEGANAGSENRPAESRPQKAPKQNSAKPQQRKSNPPPKNQKPQKEERFR